MIFYKNCPLCRHMDVRYKFSASSRYREDCKEFEYFECQNCKIIFQNPMLETNELEKDYKNMPMIRAKMSSGLSGFATRIFDKFVNFPIKKLLLNVYTSGNILDYGAGEGMIISAFDKIISSDNLYVLELTEELKNLLSKKYIVLNEKEWLEAKKNFNLIIGYGVLEHLQNPEDWIWTAAKNQKPGGKIFIAVPNLNSWQFSFFKKDWAALYAPQHLYFFSFETLKNLFEKYNYKIVRVNNFDRRSDPFLFTTSLFKKLDPNIIIKDELNNKFVIHLKVLFLFFYFINYLFVRFVSFFNPQPALVEVIVEARS